MKKTKSVEDYIENATDWQDELTALIDIVRQCGFEETIKWGAPCYVHSGQNVLGAFAFKNYFGLWFHQGVLLKDSAGVLINAQEGKTKALRQWRMTSATDLDESLILMYAKEAMQLAKAGKKIKPSRKPLVIPPKLAAAFENYPKARDGYEAMSLSLKREYADYISEAKRDETKQRRIEKIIPMILSGGGLHDKYR